MNRRRKIPAASQGYVTEMLNSALDKYLTFRELAKQMGVHENTVRNWYHGRGLPNAESFVWLQNNFGRNYLRK